MFYKLTGSVCTHLQAVLYKLTDNMLYWLTGNVLYKPTDILLYRLTGSVFYRLAVLYRLTGNCCTNLQAMCCIEHTQSTEGGDIWSPLHPPGSCHTKHSHSSQNPQTWPS